jgi:hypothetical protein
MSEEKREHGKQHEDLENHSRNNMVELYRGLGRCRASPASTAKPRAHQRTGDNTSGIDIISKLNVSLCVLYS